MERVRKEDLALFNTKSANVATIKSAFGRLLMPTLTFAACGIAILLLSICNIVNQYLENGACDNWSLLIFSIALLVIATTIIIVRAIMMKDPNIYFIGNDMYIKESKDNYLKVSPQEIDECGWMPLASQNYASIKKTSKGYPSCSYFGNVNLVVNGKTYTLGCSSLRKAKHYIDGFMNGVSVEENNFDGDPLKALYMRIMLATFIVVCMIIAFCYLMLYSANIVLSTISVILFAGSILTGIILIIRFFVKYKDIRRMELQYYQDFVVNQPVKFNKSDDCNGAQIDDCKNQDFEEYDK